MNNFQNLIEKIKTATDISLAVYSLQEIENLSPRIAKRVVSDGIVRDNDKIFFHFSTKNGMRVGVFQSNGEYDEKFAKLFAQMLSVEFSNAYDTLPISEKISMLLKGELSIEKSDGLKQELGVKNNEIFYALALLCGNKSKREEIEEYVENVKEKDDYTVVLNDTTLAYFKKAGSAYESAVDFAKILYESIKEEMCVDLCIAVAGEVRSFEDFASSYKKELIALRYGKMLFPKEKVYYYKDFAIAQIVSAIPKTELIRIYSSLITVQDASVWEDRELIDTAKAFIKCSLNVSETSRIMNIHRNTLMYRLDKIKRETGYDLRKFEDASVFNLVDLIKKTLSENIEVDKK